MNITLPRRIDGQQSPTLNGRQQITVVGANGAGKTRFVNSIINSLGNKAFTISALSALYPIRNAPTPAQSITTRYNAALQTVQFVKPMAETEFEMLLFLMLNDEINDMIAYKVQNAGIDIDKRKPMPRTKIDTVVKLWKEVFPKNDVKRDGGRIEFTNRKGERAFNPHQLSAGEKAVFFFIGASLYAPEGSVIFVDSPTLFLHRSITQSLWNTIEGHRPDCTFVYMTHDIEFPTSRTDNITVWVRTCNIETEAWDYEIISPHESLSDQLVIELTGSRKPVLFVEGDDTHSLDLKLYSLIFPEFTVKPMGSCTKVIETVRSVNDIQGFHHLDSHGIVDRDRRNAKEVAYLRQKHIFVPDVAEIENIMMLEDVVRTVARVHGKDADKAFSKVRTNVIHQFKSELRQQALMHTRHQVKRTIEVVVDRRFHDINALEEHLDNLGREIHPRTVYENLCREFNRYVQAMDYASVLRVFNQKTMLSASQVAQLCGCQHKDDYIHSIFDILKRDNADAEAIRTAVKRCLMPEAPEPAQTDAK